MDLSPRIESALEIALSRGESPGAPDNLAAAMRYAVFPGGARIRPKLCLAVAASCGTRDLSVAEAAAASIELLHCASLVHDDMPCFDDASLRRGKPSVHVAFGEPIAFLAGDALIVLAFDSLVRGVAVQAPQRLAPLHMLIARAAGMPAGIVAGQALELGDACELNDYHRAKTGALFAAATAAGAVAAGREPEAWRELGMRIGEAYQVADDVRDLAENPSEFGKSAGRDEALGRPSAVRAMGLDGALDRLETLLAEAVASVPECPGASELKTMIAAQAQRFLPKGVGRVAA
jgi:geranylgeranyl diphosphate synthase type II